MSGLRTSGSPLDAPAPVGPSNRLDSLPTGFRAVVLGASGAIGGAFVEALLALPRCAGVTALGRTTTPPVDLLDEASIAACARALPGPVHLIVIATGLLHADGLRPEKRLADVDGAAMTRAMQINAIGPMLVLKHFVPLLPTAGRCIVAVLSARVGSISDNRLGGWYSYRASKAALNMLLQTAAIETARQRPEAVVAALQPGTVRSRLSAPFGRDADMLTPQESVSGMLQALDGAIADGRAHFLDYRGDAVAW